MVNFKPPKNENELNQLTPYAVKKAYRELGDDFNKILDTKFILCNKCGEFLEKKTNFYTSKDFKTGVFPICKDCILKMVEQREYRDDPPKETKESVQRVLRMMNLPYIDYLYMNCIQSRQDIDPKDKNANKHKKSTPFLQYITSIKSLPQYIGKTWDDSEFGKNDDHNLPEVQIKENQKTIKNGRKHFGNYSNEDLMFLENEYQDWISRYECNTKAQEEIFERLCFKKWEINKATKEGKVTKDLDKTYQELLATANIQPRQNSLDTFSDAQTLGTLIQRYEETRPLPEIDPELEDVDHIGLYIDTFYRGHASKMLGLKNRFSNLYEKEMEKYTVKRPEYDEEMDSEFLFDKIFSPLTDEDQ